MSNKHQGEQRRRVVYGVLLSELDDTDQLDQNFEEVLVRFDELQFEYQHGDMTAVDYAEQLQRLIVVDSGVEWTVGATSGRWYARQHGHWVPAVPPRRGTSRLADGDANTIERDTTAPGDLLGDFLSSGVLDAALSAPPQLPDAAAPAPAPTSPELPELEVADTVLAGPNTGVDNIDSIETLSGLPSGEDPVEITAAEAPTSDRDSWATTFGAEGLGSFDDLLDDDS